VTYHQQDGQRKTVRLGTVGELDEVKARERADEVIRLNGMLPPDPDPTLAQFVKERFIPEYADVKLKHAGNLHYESLFKLILPTLGDKKFTRTFRSSSTKGRTRATRGKRSSTSKAPCRRSSGTAWSAPTSTSRRLPA